MSRRWKIFIVLALVLLGFIGIMMVTTHYQPQSEVEAYKQALLAKGEKLEIAEVVPPSVPPEKNGADVVRAAFALLVSNGDDYTNLPAMMKMVAPGKAMIGWAQPDVRSYFTNTWENVMAAAAANRPATELLRQAMDYPVIDFQLDYNAWPEVPVQHLASLKRCAQKLSAAAMCNLRAGDTASATTNLCALLALVQGTRDERTLISQLVRLAMASIAASADWELLQSANATDAELAMLQRNWDRLEFVEAVGNSFLMERAGGEFALQEMRASDADFNRFAGLPGPGGSGGGAGLRDWLDDLNDAWDNTKLAGAKFMWRASWSYSDELRALQGCQIVLEALRTVQTNQCFNPAYTNMLNRFGAMGITNNPDEWLIKLDIPDFRRIFSGELEAFSAVVRKIMVAETAKRVVITAIALKRYQLRHGNYPADLTALVPGFVSRIPVDPVDGRPLRYRLNTDGTFTLYSVGINGKDDGGDPSSGKGSKPFYNWQNPDALDWVWPQPATAEEVRNFYEHPPK